MEERLINDPAEGALKKHLERQLKVTQASVGRTRWHPNPPGAGARRHEAWHHAVVPTQSGLGLPCQQDGPS